MELTEVVFFRYLRTTQYRDEDFIYPTGISNLGGITFAVKLDYTLRKISFGVSICSDKENFDKKIGRSVALDRLTNDPYVFGLDYFYDTEYSTIRRLHEILTDKSDIIGNHGMRNLFLEKQAIF